MKISVVIITLNEEDNISKCLDSVKLVADEIVVVDSFSTDKTKEICLGYPNLKFLENEFIGYGFQKQFVVNQAKNNWILSIDADETLSDQLLEELLDLKKKDQLPYNAYNIRRQTYYQGRILRFCGMHSEKHLRFFDKSFGQFSDELVHEKVLATVPCGNLHNPMVHKPYKSLTHHLEKINAYTELFAQSKYKTKSCSKIKIISKCGVRFLTIYFVKLAILDGYAGFIWAVMGSYYSFLKYAKLFEKKHF